MCNAPPDVKNGIIVPPLENIYRNEAKVTYICHQSYKIDGEDTITCNSGNWTEPPTCIGKYISSIPTFPGLTYQLLSL